MEGKHGADLQLHISIFGSRIAFYMLRAAYIAWVLHIIAILYSNIIDHHLTHIS